MKTRDHANKKAGASALAVSLIRHAARHAPGPLAARLEEEWLADLAEQAGAAARLRFALGCWWARHVIVAEALKLAPVGATGHGGGAAFLPDDAGLFSRRTAVLAGIVVLHVAIFYAFTAGIPQRIFERPVAPINATFVDHATPVEKSIPVPDPGPSARRFFFDPGPVSVNYPPDDSPLSAGLVAHDADPGDGDAGGSAVPRVTRVQGGPGRGFPNTEDFYPSLEKSLGHTGAAAAQVCVDASGRLTADPTIAESSGLPRLDAGALALAKAGSGHYRSTTEDGKPVTSCYPFRVRFALSH